MNKLEQAIRKTVDEGLYQSSVFKNNTSNSIEEIEKMSISHLLSEKELKKKKIIYPKLKKLELINSFRELRTNISGNTGTITMITSLSAGAGVSFFARNLAAAIAFDSAKTSLLVDCNIQEAGDIANTFDLIGRNGLSDYIAEYESSIKDIIYESGVKRFRVIPFGLSSNSVDEFFSHPRFHTFLDDIKNRYRDRHIIVDSPSILMSADARILLNSCDQVILIVPYGKGSQSDLESAAKIIGRDKLSGVVFNDFIK
jgi:protein-tyrosine kinase